MPRSVAMRSSIQRPTSMRVTRRSWPRSMRRFASASHGSPSSEAVAALIIATSSSSARPASVPREASERAMQGHALADRTDWDVVAVTAAGERLATETLTRAFRHDPPSRWLFPDDCRFQEHFPMFVRAFGGAAFTERTAIAFPDGSGVALWL